MDNFTLADVNGARACCKDSGNLRVIESNMTRTTRACIVCNAKHYEFTVEAGDLRARLASLDGNDGTPGD
jgi:hypothetical protein